MVENVKVLVFKELSYIKKSPLHLFRAVKCQMKDCICNHLACHVPLYALYPTPANYYQVKTELT